MLAKTLAQPSNFLVLDEPTNDLDMDTLDLLQEVLDEYSGTILIVSHDRDFLDRVVSSVIYMKGDGTIFENAGSYSELLEKVTQESSEKTPVKITVKDIAVSEKNKKTQKLSYKQERLSVVLPEEIAVLEKEITELTEELSDPNLYQNNPQRFDEASSALALKQQEKSAKEEQWLEIEMLREELQG